MQEQKPSKQISQSSVVIISAFVFLVGVLFGGSLDPLKSMVGSWTNQLQVASISSGKDFSLYWEVYNKLKETYVDESKLTENELYYGSIKGMVDSLNDPATAFFDPEETSEYEKSKGGQYSGIGAELDTVNKQIIVLAPFEGSPAMKAGLEPGDIITKVNGENVLGKTVTEVVSVIRGDAGTEVTLNIVRPRESNKQYELKITRGNISAPSMSLKEVRDGVAVVKINRFTESTLREWKSKWDDISVDLQKKYANGEIKSVVIDLRGNPGGYFDAAILLAGDFVPKGTVISYQRNRQGEDETFKTLTDPRLEKLPMVILVNGSSASASEIFAGAMQQANRATLIGTKTYGKGTAQIILPVKGGASLHVTVTKWLLPDKRWINNENPIVPNKEVEFDYTAKEQGKDNQLDEAISIGKTK
jgi:carboxyl-terminal processing protease